MSILALLLISCSEKKHENCNPNTPMSFINIHSEKPVGTVKVYQYRNDILKDSMMFFADKKNKSDYVLTKDGDQNYSIELKKTYTYLDRFKVLIDRNEYILKDFKVGPTKVGTNFQQKDLCEVQEYNINGQLVKNNSVLIDLGKK
ncbi:MAG: hypothetical protein MUW56_13190 [Chryseobacterium sp.]|uniref:hypothetical protein n=1 Tax=Chryseobacterium sp. TaxID=1871047 RepID=UPI0025BBCFDD|nr:hypothetical protein [Chryseobacterium sp.]MCJ7934549.1 hypothetical protein [Chryseobacterium sp.]